MVGALLVWWYGFGRKRQIRVAKDRWLRWADYFSFGIISRTLFAPFRQIGAENSGGSFDMQFRQWADRLFSRTVGFIVRLFTMAFGIIFMIVVGVVCVVQILGWLLIPALPLVGLVLGLVGWMPWKV